MVSLGDAREAPDGRRVHLVSGTDGAQILLVRVFSGLVDRGARRGDVLADTFDGVAGGGGRREKESDSCECRLHDVCLHVPSACAPTIPTTLAANLGSTPGSSMGQCGTARGRSGVDDPGQFSTQEFRILSWAIVFFVLALVAAAFGFGGIAGAPASIAQILLVVFLILPVLAFVVRAFQGRSVL